MAKKPIITSFLPESGTPWPARASILNPVTRWHCKYLKYPKQVNVSYKRLKWLKMLFQQSKWLLLQPFRVATVTTMEHSTTLGTTAIGGVLRSTIQLTPGTATCTSITATYAGSPTIRKAGFLSVACGIKINLFDYRLFVYL